jgi:hypothetical protein
LALLTLQFSQPAGYINADVLIGMNLQLGNGSRYIVYGKSGNATVDLANLMVANCFQVGAGNTSDAP